MCVDVKFFQSSHRKKTWSEISSLLQLSHTSSQRKKRWVVFKDQSEIWKNEPGSVYFFLWLHACMCAKLLQSYPTLCNPMDCSLPGSSMGFSRQEYWSGLPSPPPGGPPDPGIESGSPSLQADSLLSEPLEKSHFKPSLWNSAVSYIYSRSPLH